MLFGIDPNTRYLAIVELDLKLKEGRPIIRQTFVIGQEVKGRKAEDRLLPIFDLFGDWLHLDVHDGAVVWCEAVAFAGGSRSLVQMAAMQTAVQLACHRAGVPCHMVANTLWKKEVIGKGNASKEEVAAFLQMHHGLPADWSPPDLYDAYGVAVAGLKRHRLDVE